MHTKIQKRKFNKINNNGKIS